MSKPFQFRQFQVAHDRAAMKVGTDGVLLGAWACAGQQPPTILDVGTGTGLIALMMAQRFPQADIHALELDPEALEEAVHNFEQSVFASRIKGIQANFLEWPIESRYAAIVCNPPFYQDAIASSIEKRNWARQEKFLPPALFLERCRNHLTTDGRLAVVIPVERIHHWKAEAERLQFFLARECAIKGHAEATISRYLLEWTFQETTCEKTELILEESRGQKSSDYLKWVDPFYL